MSHGRPFASSPLRRLVSRGPSFRGFLVVAYPIFHSLVSIPDQPFVFFKGEVLKPSAVVRTTLSLATSLPPVACPLSIRTDANTPLFSNLRWFATGHTLSALSHARKWDPCPLCGQWPQQEDSTN